jgi:2-polyprenyl-6-methoxyphenol hydroxylase-like FAD-dependent oxidoreductase
MAVLEHAIVMGGSVAGLLAAAALAPHSERVTIVDRDPLPADGPEAFAPRRGVPQAGTVHRLLALGEARMEQLLPGLREELLAAGAAPRAAQEADPVLDAAMPYDGPDADAAGASSDESGSADPDSVDTAPAGTATAPTVPEGTAPEAPGVDDPGTLWLTRPLLEGVLRRRVLSLANVDALQGAVGGLLTTDDQRIVTGVQLRGATPDELHGDLVVDVAGRSSRAATWVEGLGAARPRTLGTRVHVAYSCQRLRLRDGALPAGTEALSAPASGRSPFTIDLEPCGDGEHILSVAGTGRSEPPTDLEGLLDMVALLPSREIADALDSALEDAEPVGETSTAKAAGAHRQLWEETADAPEGLVHVGDAAAMFTPLYGQGMTMAAVGAAALGEELGEHGADGLAARFPRVLGALLDPAWEITTSRDARIPGAELLVDGAVVEELPAPGLQPAR